MTFDLVTIWAGIIAFAVMAYVVMDGFDLGIGILFPLLKPGSERDLAIASIAPVWDGNETWLVLGGGGLLAAFPLAYAIVLPALYAPLIAMLLALVLRGVAFEFRFRNPRHRALWDVAFTLGSGLATFAQGVALGALLQGITIRGRGYGGGWWEWLSWFSLLTGLSLMIAYALLGAAWLNWRSEGAVGAKMRRVARVLAFALAGVIVAVSLGTLTLEAQYYQRWITYPGIVATAPVPLLTAGVFVMLLRSLAKKQDLAPFLWTLAVFALCFAGLAVSIWPDVIPARLSIWQAAAPPRSLGFMLVGAVFAVPAILGYSFWAYWVFRGKVTEPHYH